MLMLDGGGAKHYKYYLAKDHSQPHMRL